jgi:hypothetical protein
MRTFLRGNAKLLVLAFAVMLAVPAIAFADALKVDGDVLNQSNSKNTKFCLTPNNGGSVNQAVTIDYNGNQHFASGANVNITASVETAGQGFITPTGGSVTTANWDAPQDKVTTGNLPLSVGPNWVAGTYKVTYTATGAKAGGGTLTIDGFSNIIISNNATSGCGDGGGTTTNNAPTVNVTGIDATNYEIGNEPTAGCSVVDPEDGSAATATPVVDRSGLNAYGLGPVTVTCSYTDTGGEEGTDQVTYNIVDTGAPLITHVSDSLASPDGSNQWYISPVTTTFKAEDFNGASPAGAGAGFAGHTNPYNFTVGSGAAEGNNVSINSGTVSDVAGNVSNSVSGGPFKIDLTNPTILASLSPAADTNTGWYNLNTGPPTVHYNCADADGDGDSTNGGASGIATTGGCTADHLFGEGADQGDQGTATDNAGRTATDSVSNVDVDLTAPSLGNIQDSNAPSSNVCTASGPPTQPTGFSPSDGLSGLASSGQAWTPVLTTSPTYPFGTYGYEAHATDVAGNTSSYGPKTYTYGYGIGSGGLAYNGVLQPINMPPATGTFVPSVFKLGSTIPVKFTLACGQTPYGNAVAKLFVKKTDSTVDGDVNEAISTAASTTGNLFRYDATAGQYIFNLSTKGGYTDANGQNVSFAAGSWVVTIKFLDGTTKTATFDIKK